MNDEDKEYFDKKLERIDSLIRNHDMNIKKVIKSLNKQEVINYIKMTGIVILIISGYISIEKGFQFLIGLL